MHIVKVVCIVGKIAIVVGMLLLATYMYTAKYKKCTMIPVMLVAYCLILITLIGLDMTNKYIAGFFLMVYMSNLFNFIGFYKILDHLPGAPGKQVRESTRTYFRIMCGMYGITLALAFIPRFGPWCSADKVYPACMNWTSCLFLINFAFHCYMKCRKDFYLSSGDFEMSQDSV